MWFLIRMIDGTLYYFLAILINAFGVIAGQYATGTQEPARPVVVCVALGAVLTVFISYKLMRRYLCPAIREAWTRGL